MRASPRGVIPGTVSGPRTPDVHITIGSVEIRAQQAARPTPPKANPTRALKPTLSLDAYLTKRREGRP
jgi:hypothetical protein